jgi:hypothetical protein
MSNKNYLYFVILLYGFTYFCDMVKQFGSTPLVTKSTFMDYAAVNKIMRLGVVGIKVWVNTIS